MKLIDKDALVVEIDNMLNTKEHTSHSDEVTFNSGRWKALKKVKDILDTLEVKEKEADLQEEPKTEWLQELQERLDSLSKEDFEKVWAKYSRYGCEEPVSEDLKTEIDKYIIDNFTVDREVLIRLGIVEKDYIYSLDRGDMLALVEHFINWQKAHLLKPADGDDLPEIDREVIALLDNGLVGFAHRPPEYWDGKNIVTGKVTRHYPKTYGKGGWNIPNVKYWLDCSMPKEIEL